MLINFTEFAISVVPREEISLTEPVSNLHFGEEIGITSNYRIFFRIMAEAHRSELLEHFEIDVEGDISGLITVDDEHLASNSYIFLNENHMDGMFRALYTASGSPLLIEISLVPVLAEKVSKGRRVFGLREPSISVKRAAL